MGCTPCAIGIMALSILHTNDWHGRLDQAKAERLKALREEFNALLLDAGDLIRSGNVAIPFSPDPAWEWMALAGYHAMTIGNREFHFSAKGFLAKVGAAPCPLLCANLRAKSPDAPLPVVPYLLLEQGGYRIGLLGLTVPMITPRMKSAWLSAYLFDPPIQVAARWVPVLRAQVDLLIALTHIGVQEDRRLASQVSGFDLIIGGHSHTPLCPPEVVAGVPILQAEPYGHSVGLVQLHWIDRWELEAQRIPF